MISITGVYQAGRTSVEEACDPEPELVASLSFFPAVWPEGSGGPAPVCYRNPWYILSGGARQLENAVNGELRERRAFENP